MNVYKHVVRGCVIVGALALGWATQAAAQVTAGMLVGSVTDPTGQPLARAEVRVTDDLRHVSRTVITDDTGRYRVVDLPPAEYGVSASAAGFGQLTRRAVRVPVDSTVRVDFQLALAAIAQSVDVTGAAGVVQPATSGVGVVLDRSRIETLPLNRRDFLQLALLTPGIEGPVENSELSSRGSIAMHANGGREEFNNFLLDGVDNNDVYVNRYVVQPSVDSIQEFKVATNGYSAEYGRNAAGQVNVITRSGTSQLRAFGYEYFRDRGLDAANFFEENGKQRFSRNQFGGGVGGPLVKDRTFFFGTLDLLRERQGVSQLGTVPTDLQRAGTLSGRVVDPFSGQPFAGGVIPAARISPIARQIVALFPAANRAGATNYLGQPLQTEDDTQGSIRVDHRLSNSDRLSVRYSGGAVDLFEPYAEGANNTTTAGFGDVVADRTWNVMAQHEHVSGRATNALRFGANGFGRDVLTENHATNVGAAWGVNWLNVPSTSFGYPVIDVAGYSRLGDAFSLPLLRTATTYQLADDLTIDRGAHLLKAGGEARYLRLNSQLDLFSRGQLSFTGAFTGSGLGDLLLGLPTFGIQAQADNPIRMRTNVWSAYLQDDWRLRPNLTLNIGARYEYTAPPVDANDGMTAFNPSTGQLSKVGTNGISRSGISPDRNNIAPRLGVSWSPTPSTVIRGGYGLYYDSGMMTVNTSQYFNPPQFNLRLFFPSASGLLSLNNPFPLSAGFVPPPTLSALSPDIVNGYLQHWNASVQRDVTAIGTVTVTYAASKGSNLVRPLNINQAVPGPGDVQLRRPNPAYSDIFFVESAGRSRYDSLQLSFDRALKRGVSVLATYTLARSNDDASAFLGVPSDKNLPQDSRNPGAEWAPSSFDVRHRVTLAYIVALPSTNVWTRNMQIQGIVVMHSGQPFTPLLRFDNSNTGNTGGSTAGSDRPNVVGNTELSNPTADQWFNTAAFSIPAAGTFGNAGRNSVRGPGFASFDVAVSKRLQTNRRFGTTMELQVFNLFNKTNFNLPGNLADEQATFGRILSAQAPRQVQLSVRFDL